MEVVRVPERKKLPDVRYALTSDGVELAVLNVLEPAFAVPVDEGEQRALSERFIQEQRAFQRIPGPLRKLMLRFFLKGSLLGNALRHAGTSFLGGLDTYVMKLGPAALPSALAKPVDLKLASALPALSMRLRLQDTARLLADAISSASSSEPERPLVLLNIAGGPASDSLNALILLAAERRELVARRRIAIRVLDLDDKGPAFGRNMLKALASDGGPLHGLDVRLDRIAYDWTQASTLAPMLESARSEGALVSVSSEGGLFEYASDAIILQNLTTLREGLGEEARVVGSVTRNDEAMRLLRRNSPIPTVPRGLEAFRELAARAHFRVARSVERFLSDQVLLEPTG